MKHYRQNTVYALKRAYGKPAVLFRVIGKTLNYKTGTHIIARSRTNIKRAMFLPTNVTRKIITRTDFYFDPDKRLVLIDRRDIDFEITIGDYLIYKLEKYNVIEVNDYAVNGAFLLVVQSDGRSKYMLADDAVIVVSTAGETT